MFKRLSKLLGLKPKPKNNHPPSLKESPLNSDHYVVNTMLHFMKLNIELIYMNHGIRKEISFDPIDGDPYETTLGIWRNFRNVAGKAFTDVIKDLQKNAMN